MCLGAIADLGVPLDYLRDHLNHLGIGDEFHLRTERVHRNGQQATKVYLDVLHTDPDGDCPAAAIAHPASAVPPHPTQGDARDPGSLDQEEEEDHAHVHPHPHAHAHVHPHAQTDGDQEAGDRRQHDGLNFTRDPSVPIGQNRPIHRDSGNGSAGKSAAPIRHLPEIVQMIRSAKLPQRAESWSLSVFHRLAEAEGAVHGIPPEQVHFHEVGATDAIVDIVGTCLGLDWLGVEQVYCSPLPTGGGTVRAAHGRLPVPAPAVLQLFALRQVPVYSNGIERELVTPTGAAIATALASRFGPPPAMVLYRVGLGAGTHLLPLPNILRLWIGEGQQIQYGDQGAGKAAKQGGNIATLPSLLPEAPDLETIVTLETQIDDLNPQAIGYLFERLFAVGALDVFTQAIGMKKSRPGMLLTVICPPEMAAACETLLFRETTTLGIRQSVQQRRILPRQIESVQTEYGAVRVKVAWAEGSQPTHVQPEYEDCARIALAHNLPWREVHRLSLQAWYAQATLG